MPKNKKRLPKYGRVAKPQPMRLTERDKCILQAIHAYDGMLGFSQIQRLFFGGKSQAEMRLRLLYQHRFVNRPNREQRLRLTEMIYWLDKNGAEIVAGLNSTKLTDFSWRQQPRWFQVEHDLAVNDFRMNIEQACRKTLEVNLETWIPEGEFWAYPDQVNYLYNDKKINRNIRPDGFFILTTDEHYLRYLLEIDRSTEDNPRFLREKILPGLTYLKSAAYEKRFGHKSGRWLVVTTSKQRMDNMMSQARRGGAEGLFYFTTYDQLNVNTILLSPVWRRADREEPVPLLFLD